MPRLADIEDLMRYLDLRDPVRVDGQLLEGILEGAERFAEQYTGRIFAPDPPLDADPFLPVTKVYAVSGPGWVRVNDLRSIGTITLDGAVLASGTGYYLDPSAWSEPATHIFISARRSATSVIGTLSIAGHWGFNPTPPDVKDAVLAMAARRWRERDAAYSDSISLVEGGIMNYFRQIPAYVKDVLDLYRVPRIALVNA